jgi:carotenoid 1,2-hydratase
VESILPTSGVAQQNPRALFSRGQRSSRSGSTNGGDVGATGSSKSDLRSEFNRKVPSSAWWYADAVSDDGQFGITLIALIGNVFSPYYFRAKNSNTQSNPENHCALNVVIYNKTNKKWSLTERGENAVNRNAYEFTIGPSSLSWNGNFLEFDINEYTVPFPTKLKGTIRIHPSYLTNKTYSLDQQGRHHWWPAAPKSYVEVSMLNPSINWNGEGYFDANWGEEPLERKFNSWNWSCAKLKQNERAISYFTKNIDEPDSNLFLHVDANGSVNTIENEVDIKPLKKTTVWRMPRETNVEAGQTAKVIKTLEDTPFYSRSIISSYVYGQRCQALHESLDLRRFAKSTTQLMLPFRMPRNKFYKI